MCLKGLASFYGDKRRHIITTQVDHKCVLDSCRKLEDEGFDVTYLPVTTEGLVDLNVLKEAIRPDTLACSVIHVNNEIGTVQPLAEIGLGAGHLDPRPPELVADEAEEQEAGDHQRPSQQPNPPTPVVGFGWEIPSGPTRTPPGGPGPGSSRPTAGADRLPRQLPRSGNGLAVRGQPSLRAALHIAKLPVACCGVGRAGGPGSA